MDAFVVDASDYSGHLIRQRLNASEALPTEWFLRNKSNSGGLNLITVRSAHTVFVFCIYLRTNSDLCHLQRKLIGFYNRDEKCLQRGTDWIFK
jgi:hypothetical protein